MLVEAWICLRLHLGNNLFGCVAGLVNFLQQNSVYITSFFRIGLHKFDRKIRVRRPIAELRHNSTRYAKCGFLSIARWSGLNVTN